LSGGTGDAVWLEGRLATLSAADEGPYGIVEDGALVVGGGRIEWIGPRSELPAKLAAGRLTRSAGGRWVTPGLVDCHTHLVYAGHRADEFERRLEGASYEALARAGGGILSTVRATRAADEEALLESASRRLAGFLREGVTTVEIKSGYGLDLETEMKQLRVARGLGARHPLDVVTTFLGAHTLPPEHAGDADRYIDFVCDTVLPAVAEAGLADAVDAFCERIGFTLGQVERVFAAARAHGLPVKLHAEQLSDSGGTALAARYRALSADHLEYLSAEGVEAMARAGTVAVLLPAAFYFLGETRKPPVAALRERGVPMALASDANPGSAPVGSLLLMLNMACVLFGLTPAEALAGATRNAAAALGLADRLGTLEAGKQADFVLWDIEHPAELAYRFGANPCFQVIKRGLAVA